MKVLIINTNRNRQPFAVLPIGACIIAEAVRRAGHSVRMLDLMFENHPVRALSAELRKEIPDVVGLSIRNIDNNNMQSPAVFFSELPDLVALIRERTQASTIIGGAAMGVMPEALLRYSNADWAIIGNGETVFPQMLDLFARRQRLDGLPGLGWIEKNAYHQNPADKSNPSNNCLVPDFSRWVGIKKYLSGLSTIPIQTKRGCPYECIYCTYSISEGSAYRLCDSEDVVAGVQRLVDAGYRDIEFVDNVFNAPYDHALAICKGLERFKPKVRFHTFELNPLFIDDTLLSAMEKAGFIGFGITAESASDIVLSNLKKTYTTQHIQHAAECIRRSSLPCVWIFMLGGPGETPDTIQETLDFVQNNIRPNDIAFFNIGLRIYPGTELERIARREGILKVPAADMLNPVFYLSPQLDKAWLMQKMQTVMKTHMNFLDSESLANPLVPLIHRIIYRLGMKLPVWTHTPFLRKTLRSIGLNV